MRIITVMNDGQADSMDYRLSEDDETTQALLRYRNQLKEGYRGLRMNPENEGLKDVTWEIEQKEYVIHNVPFKIYENHSSERVYSSDVTMKLLLLKDLMESDEIPAEIDFRKSMDIQLQ